MSLHVCLLGDANSVHLRRWAGEMLARDFRISVVTARPESQEGVEQRILSPVRHSFDWLARVVEARAQLALLAPDIVHAHYITSYGYLTARCGRRPLVMTAWGSDLLVTPRRNPLARWLTGWTLRRADLITADSHDLLLAAQSYRPQASTHLIHWGVDLQRFQPTHWEHKPPHSFHIASLRAWEPNYQIDLIVEALAVLRRQCPQAQAHLHLMGGGSEEEALRGRVSALGLTACVQFHGRLDDAQMQAVLRHCHVSVSVPRSDATSVSVLESMACGLPVIASDLPANRHWLLIPDDPQSESCLIATGRPAGVVQSMANALQQLCEQPLRALRWGAHHRERMVREGARSLQMDTMADLYRSLVTTRDA